MCSGAKLRLSPLLQIQITPAGLRKWVQELYPDGVPQLGSKGIIICPQTGAVFPDKKATQVREKFPDVTATSQPT